MELDQELLFNFASIFATILLLLATLTTIFHRLKWRWPTKVNCWFCNSYTKIWRQQLDWWLCPSCEQYNGFAKNGDYSYSIPEQYRSTSSGVKRYCSVGQVRVPETGQTERAGLCEKCNTYESIKLSKLAEFEPVRQRNYEYEVRRFKESLEESYPLCQNCKTTVRGVLQKQKIWLARYKMLLFKQRPIQAIINNTKYSESMFRALSTILDSMVAYNTELLLLPLCGLFFQLCACWATPVKRRNTDIMLAFFWICIILLAPFKDLKLLKTDLRGEWLRLEHVTQYHVIMMFALVIGFVNVKPRTYSTAYSNDLSFKKIESPRESTNENSANTERQVDRKPGKELTGIDAGSIMMNGIMANHQEKQVASNSLFSLNAMMPTEPARAVAKSVLSSSYLLNTSLNTLSTLSLSEEGPRVPLNKQPRMFERRVYGTKSPDLFKRSVACPTKRSILSPPKLRSFTQTSWVAGGFWQETVDQPTTLSRSSSQSSGFGSTGSNFAPSREPSVHEFDQCSVASETVQSRFNTGSPVSGSQFSRFVEPKPPIAQKLLLGPQFQQNFVQGTVKGNFVEKPFNVQDGFHGGAAVVGSPVWVPVLLCGSLVLNIIVLCTTLLR